jgi:hypothetical protein
MLESARCGLGVVLVAAWRGTIVTQRHEAAKSWSSDEEAARAKTYGVVEGKEIPVDFGYY